MAPVVGRVLVEIAKALGKAVIAGVGLELARAASGHVKRAVGPKDKETAPKDVASDPASKDEAREPQRAEAASRDDASELERVRRENDALRRELEALQRERSPVSR